MALPLLTTKLFPPASAPVVIPRDRLAARLDEGLRGALTLVVSPAGYGKTTLVSQWLARAPVRGCWLSLERADDDPGRFWEYVVMALAQQAPEVTAEGELRLEAPDPDYDAVVISILNGFAGLSSNGDGPITLVLDDVHVLENPTIHQGLTTLIENAPPQLRLVLLSRSDPLLPLPRLRTRRALTELRQDDLRFRPEEVEGYLRELGLSVPEESLRALEERTEGWAASLQLAALGMERLDAAERADFIRRFSGNDRFVVDYLMDEVIEGQTPAVEHFLLATSVLDRMSEEVCRAVATAAGLEGPLPALEDLEAAGLFVLPLDRERRWYRYHHLFAELLRIRAAERFDVSALLVAAAIWSGEHADVEEALEYALRAERPEVAEQVLVDRFPFMLGRGQLAAIRRCIARLKPGTAENHASLATAMAYVEHLSSNLEEGQKWCSLAERAKDSVDADHRRVLKGHMAILAGMRACGEGFPARVLPLARQAREFFSEWEFGDFLLGVIEMQETLVALADERLSDAIETGRQAYRRGLTTGNQHAGSSALQAAGYAALAMGRIEEVIQLAREAVTERGRDRPAHPLLLAYLQVPLAAALTRAGRLEEATRTLAAARTAVEAADVTNVRALVLAEGARLALASGRHAEAAGLGAALLDLLEEETVILLSDPALEAVAIEAMIAGGRGVDAALWFNDLEGTTESRGWDVVSRTTLARVVLAQGDARRAEQTAAEAIRRAEAVGAWLWFDDATVLRARALEELRDGKSVEILLRAFPGVQERDHLFPFLAAGRDILPLLSRVLAAGSGDVDPRWIARVSAMIEAQGADESGPLSERESEILAFLAEGLSNAAIAERLFLSVGTVKKHTHNIYTKLGARRRTEAVAKAREMGLLS